MPHSFWLMIATTPWWIYLFFIYLIRISLFVTKPRLMTIKPLYYMVLPLFAFMLIACYLIPPTNKALLFTVPVFMIGSLFGIVRAKWQGVKAVTDKQQLFLPGSWLMFIIVIGLFLTRQYLIYHGDFNLMEWMKTDGSAVLLPLYAFSIGINVSQLAYFRRLIQRGPYATPDDLNVLTHRLSKGYS